MATIESLVKDDYECHYSFEDHLVRIIYRGTVTPQATKEVYAWMGESMAALPEDEKVYGCIMDFRDVESFAAPNISTARKEAKSLQQEQSERSQQIPSALIVATTYQEMMLRTTMKLTGQKEQDELSRVRVVKSVDEAMAHFEHWHVQK